MMDAESHGPSTGARMAASARRGRRSWRALAREQRFAGLAALGLFVTMLLPWYTGSDTVKAVINGRLQVATSHDHQSALQAFSWVEAAVLLTALFVLGLLFARGERRAFHLPGGDGAVITAAGCWASVLIVWRLFDRPDLGRGVAVGLTWGIFVGLAASGMLAYAGRRIAVAHRPEPELPRAVRRPRPAGATSPVPAAGDIRIPEERPHLEETQVLGDAPTRRGGAEERPDLERTRALGDAPTERGEY